MFLASSNRRHKKNVSIGLGIVNTKYIVDLLFVGCYYLCMAKSVTERMTALLERREGHDTIPIPRGDDTPALPPRRSKAPVGKRKGFVPPSKPGGRGRPKTDTQVIKR